MDIYENPSEHYGHYAPSPAYPLTSTSSTVAAAPSTVDRSVQSTIDKRPRNNFFSEEAKYAAAAAVAAVSSSSVGGSFGGSVEGIADGNTNNSHSHCGSNSNLSDGDLLNNTRSSSFGRPMQHNSQILLSAVSADASPYSSDSNAAAATSFSPRMPPRNAARAKRATAATGSAEELN